MTTTFWKDAAASLPPTVQRRYAAEFATAERFDELFDDCIEAWGEARRMLAGSRELIAHGLRAAARLLVHAADRL